MLQKNIAIRKHADDSTYTALGNENFMLRHKKLPLTLRKAFFEMKLKEYEQEQNKEEDSKKTDNWLKENLRFLVE